MLPPCGEWSWIYYNAIACTVASIYFDSVQAFFEPPFRNKSLTDCHKNVGYINTPGTLCCTHIFVQICPWENPIELTPPIHLFFLRILTGRTPELIRISMTEGSNDVTCLGTKKCLFGYVKDEKHFQGIYDSQTIVFCHIIKLQPELDVQ